MAIMLPDLGESLANAVETDHQVRLASIVSVDVQGFSTLSERDQARAARQVAALRARIETCAERNGGRVFNSAGDGFMLEFPSAGAALGCINDLLDKRGKGEPPIRIGAHVGDVIVTITNDLLGHGINVAARLQSLAAPNSALVSGEFRSMARNSPQAAFLARGRQPLDNIEQKVQTYAIISQRQRFMRQAKRVLAVAAAAGIVAVAAPIAYPHLVAMAHDYGLTEIRVDKLPDTLRELVPTTPSSTPKP
jgi:class 3 adenylate cyclase